MSLVHIPQDDAFGKEPTERGKTSQFFVRGRNARYQAPPRTDPEHAELLHWAPASSHTAKAFVRIWMIDTGDREPLVHVPLHTIPGDVAFVAPPRETALPQPRNFLAESLQRLGIMRYAVVPIVGFFA